MPGKLRVSGGRHDHGHGRDVLSVRDASASTLAVARPKPDPNRDMDDVQSSNIHASSALRRCSTGDNPCALDRNSADAPCHRDRDHAWRDRLDLVWEKRLRLAMQSA